MIENIEKEKNVLYDLHVIPKSNFWNPFLWVGETYF